MRFNPKDYYISPNDYATAKQNGIMPRTLEYRVRILGWKKENAINHPVTERNNFGDWGKVASGNGIGYKTFIARVNRMGMSAEQAATKPLHDKRKAARELSDINRKYPKEFVEKAKRNGISYVTFGRRMRLGWGLEDAATIPPIHPSIRGKCSVKYRNKARSDK